MSKAAPQINERREPARLSVKRTGSFRLPAVASCRSPMLDKCDRCRPHNNPHLMESSVEDISIYTPEERQLLSLFYPLLMERFDKIGPDGRFVHYSSADSAMSILTNREVWLRNTTCMNDFSEVEHGIEALVEAYGSPTGKQFQKILNETLGDVCKEVERLFNSHLNGLRYNSYIICVSEHRTVEDVTGRLSMWRAYGSTAGVALVMKAAAFRSKTNFLGAYSSPVRYVDKSGLEDEFSRIVEGFSQNVALLKTLDRDLVKGHLFNMFKWAALSIKHPGFLEELEWRVVHSPTLEPSKVLKPAIKTIRGVPQKVFRLPLQKFEDGFSTAIPDLIDRIIIGPSEYPLAMHEAFVELLRDAGVPDPLQRVFVSDIPLRVH